MHSYFNMGITSYPRENTCLNVSVYSIAGASTKNVHRVIFTKDFFLNNFFGGQFTHIQSYSDTVIEIEIYSNPNQNTCLNVHNV